MLPKTKDGNHKEMPAQLVQGRSLVPIDLYEVLARLDE